MTEPLTIVGVEEDRGRAIAIVDALKASGDSEIFVIGNALGPLRTISVQAPDLVPIDIDKPSRGMLKNLTRASGPLERPLAKFVSGAAGGLEQAAWKTGRWLSRPDNSTSASEMASRRQYLDLPAEIIDMDLTGCLTIAKRVDQRRSKGSGHPPGRRNLSVAQPAAPDRRPIRGRPRSGRSDGGRDVPDRPPPPGPAVEER
jgi:hypothetical protein